jgi:eukaryotic-like serine/threonine-protein kinase
MGIVYLAEQHEPLRRRVALKLLKQGLDSARVLARFESERQALALMNHPGVARVFDAGVTDDGRPYFVMEYVAGIPITEFCDRRQLSVSERLKLFRQVCDAIITRIKRVDSSRYQAVERSGHRTGWHARRSR